MSIDRNSFASLIHSRPLDVHTWSDYSEVNLFIDEIFNRLPPLSLNKNKFKKHLKVVLLDLYVAWIGDPTLRISVSLDHNAYKVRSRHNELFIGKLVIKVVEVLAAEGLINIAKGFHDPSTEKGYTTRIWPTELLVTYFHEARFSQFQISYSQERETVVLRNKAGEDIERYEDNEEVIQTRRLLRAYNALLDQTHIDLDFLQNQVVTLGEKQRKHRLEINQRNKFVRRIFNEGRWDKGGRFYGGWWQRCPTDLRPHIVFDGIMTEEVDFSGLHIVLLYARRGIDYWRQIGGDPYLVEAPEGWPEDIDIRTSAKLLLLVAINASDEKKAFAAFRRQADRSTSAAHLKNVQLQGLLTSLKAKHTAIANDLASGAGIDLMFIDSQITFRLLQYYTDRGIPVLSIHDSYIVPYGYSVCLSKQMQIECEAITGIPQVKVKHATVSWVDSSLETEVQEELGIDAGLKYGMPSERHVRELALFQEFKGKPDREEWVNTWTPIY